MSAVQLHTVSTVVPTPRLPKGEPELRGRPGGAAPPRAGLFPNQVLGCPQHQLPEARGARFTAGDGQVTVRKCHSVGSRSSPGAEAARRGRPGGGGGGAEARTASAPGSARTRALPAPRPEGGTPARGRIQQERRAARLPPGKQPPAARPPPPARSPRLPAPPPPPPPPGSRWLQPPTPGGESRLAGGRRLSPATDTAAVAGAGKWSAATTERRDVLLPLTGSFPTSGCPTRYSSHSAALRDPPPPPPHPIASSPPPLPQPARPFLLLSASKWRQALFGGCSNRTAADSTRGAGRAPRGCAAPPADRPAARARRPAGLPSAPPRARTRAPASAPLRPARRARARARRRTGTPPLWPRDP
ncbi:basic proline-rich protein-like [Hippopotamus amphibius kiboko]|uniref:basic proline-rich protein-like n=1 Tax=Hippopotamus amphibius kiboko TaxID=575201 RepID=UPI002591E252|nr:basic proline-rich protein-like [Hippopotamus amphibius kiboko]